MSGGAYTKIGAKLVEWGYSAIPIMPGSKRPGELRKGEWIGKTGWNQEYTKRLPSRFEVQLWSVTEAGVGVVCGAASKHLVGVDIDSDDPAIRSAIVAALPHTDLVKRGAKGQTLFFRGPTIEESKSWNLPKPDGKKYRVCDLIGPGRQTLLPPTIHPDTGNPYVWLGGVALEDVNPEELPELTPEHVAAIDAALTPFGYEAEPEHPEPGAKPGAAGIDTERPVHRQLNDAAVVNLEAWVPQLPSVMRIRKRPQGYEGVAVWRASNTGQPIEKRKLNLKFDRSGIVDFGDGPRTYTPLNVVMAALDVDREQAFKWLSDALGWNDEKPILFKPKQPASAPEPTPEPESAPETPPELPEKPLPAIVPPIPLPEAPKLPAAPAPEKKRPHALEALTHCSGLVGDIVSWIEATARRPNRVMALGVAVSVIGTLLGRRVAGPTRSATHLFVTCLAPTGSGKQHPLDCTPLLLRSAGAGNTVGPSQFISFPAVVNMLKRQPLALSAQDEFGAFLKRINGRKASTYEIGISQSLRTIWGISFADFMTPEYAGQASVSVFAPALSIFGLSTPEEFYDGLQGSELKNGFLNRFLVIKAKRTEPRTPECEPGKVPDDIAFGLGDIYRWGAAPESLATARINDPAFRPEPVVLRWANLPASDCFRELENHVQALIDKDHEVSWYMSRTAEIAIRLATIRAVGRHGPGDTTVDRSDVEWGRDIALACGHMLAAEAKLYMAENERQAWSNRILELVRRNKVATPRMVQQKIRGALKSAEIKDILDGLCEAGIVEAQAGQQNGKLIRAAAYRYVGE